MSFRGRGTRLLLPFGLEYADILGNGLGVHENTLLLPINGELNAKEHSISRQQITIARLVADGPFHTGSVEDEQSHSDINGVGDGIVRHSDKYKKPRKVGRTIEEHPYELDFFPDELYSVMGISGTQRKKLLSLSKYKKDGQLTDFGTTDEAQSILDKLKEMAEDVEDENNEREEEEDIDDEFEDDDDDDYNAEKYFDDGDDDAGDGDDDEAAF